MKNINKIILYGFVVTLLILKPAIAKAKIRYDLIYEDTPILDYMYEDKTDPEESNDYEKYVISPYTLVRLPLKLQNKNTVLSPGYYLVKPERKSGYEFIIFKQNGKVAGIAPIYQKLLTNPLEVFPEPPKPKIKWYKKPFHFTKKVVSWPFKKIYEKKHPPAPDKAKIEYELVENGVYYEFRLYKSNFLYKSLFKVVPMQ